MKRISTLFLLLLPFPLHAEVPKRVITIGGALTEIVYALSAETLLVGNDTTSYFPEEAETLPKVGYQRALSAEGILSLRPDLVILTNEAGPPVVIKQLVAAKVKMLQLKAGRSVDDIIVAISRIGKALGRTKQANQLINEIQVMQKQLVHTTEVQTKKPKVLMVHQHTGSAPIAAGTDTAADSIIRLSGGVNIVNEFSGYKPLTPEAAIAFAPDIIIIAVPKASQVTNKSQLIHHSALAQTPAAKNGHVYVIDALQLLGFGPRTVDTAISVHKLYKGL